MFWTKCCIVHKRSIHATTLYTPTLSNVHQRCHTILAALIVLVVVRIVPRISSGRGSMDQQPRLFAKPTATQVEYALELFVVEKVVEKPNVALFTCAPKGYVVGCVSGGREKQRGGILQRQACRDDKHAAMCSVSMRLYQHTKWIIFQIALIAVYITFLEPYHLCAGCKCSNEQSLST